MLKVSYLLIIVCMAAATFIEKSRGTGFVAHNVYGAWWFTALWAILTAAAAVHFIRRRIRRPAIVSLHASFAVILGGALLTHLTSTRGVMQLREGETTSLYLTPDGGGTSQRSLPFGVRLDKFDIEYHEGGTAPADYRSEISLVRGGETVGKATVSMNNICTYGGIRLYQSDYDRDLRGSTLAVNADPWGIPVTYLGYALLFVSLVWMLADPKGTFRRLLRSPLLKNGLVCAAVLAAVGAASPCRAATVLPRETAAEMGRLNILYNGRVCPLQTFAIDFTKKLCGRSSYAGYTAEQVLTGFMFWGDEWSREPIIRMKGGALRERLQLPAYCSVSTFFNTDMGGYILGPYVREYLDGNGDRFHRDVADIDDRLMLVMEVRRGPLLKLFPRMTSGHAVWYAATALSDSTPARLLSQLGRYAAEGNQAETARAIGEIREYQTANGGTSVPSPLRAGAERMYNTIPFATILFMVNLAMGAVTLLLEIRNMTSRRQQPTSGSCRRLTPGQWFPLSVMLLSLAALTFCEALRWIVGGTVPLSNGYETMLFTAWTVMLLSVVAARRFRIALVFGFFMSGLFLLVSHISLMDPNITHVMPVLNSPLLSLHVSVIMISFALLAMTFGCGVTAIAVAMAGGKGAAGRDTRLESLQLLSRIFLYPALATLAAGIFIGAIWANVSWGQYWGWDPKEVWALITLMVYAIAVHTGSVPALRRPLVYHIFMTAAFLTVLMTYFGVNYILGGMHSYA